MPCDVCFYRKGMQSVVFAVIKRHMCKSNRQGMLRLESSLIEIAGNSPANDLIRYSYPVSFNQTQMTSRKVKLLK